MEDTSGTGRISNADVHFRRFLQSLKERGATLLVVGQIPSWAHEEACRRMVGSTDVERRRLFVTAGSNASERLIESFRAKNVSVTDNCAHLSVQAERRSLSAVRVPESTDCYHRVNVDGKVSSIGVEFVNCVEHLQSTEFAPGELRVCFDALEYLIDTYELQTVFSFIHAVGGFITGHGGIGHFHLPVDPSSHAVRTLSELFDATVEIRVVGDEVEQQWHLRDSDSSSEWLPL